MDEVLKGRIWDIPEKQCAANPDDRTSFMPHFPECGEFRFQGNLGFGGKVYYGAFGNVFVGAYVEDVERYGLAAHIDIVNDHLFSLLFPGKGTRYV